MSEGRIYPSTEQDDWLCSGCGRTFADASQEEAVNTCCVYCGADNWQPQNSDNAAQAAKGA